MVVIIDDDARVALARAMKVQERLLNIDNFADVAHQDIVEFFRCRKLLR